MSCSSKKVSPCSTITKRNSSQIHKGFNVILDLDNTVLCSLSLDGELSQLSPSVKRSLISHKMKDYYEVFERPYLQKFLNWLFSNYDVSVFTAADKDYAAFILDRIIAPPKSGRELNYVFFGYHCGISEAHYNSTKDLRLLWEKFSLEGFNKYNTLIVDDNPDVCKSNPDNCVRAPPFELLDKKGKTVNEAVNDKWLLHAMIEIQRKQAMIQSKDEY